ncbi:hypothetical protein ACA910_020376 [Epithemia clementina (nom. ined.)]
MRSKKNQNHEDPTMLESGKMMLEDSSSEEDHSVIVEDEENGSSTGENGAVAVTHSSDSSDSIQIAKSESRAVLTAKLVVYTALSFLAIATAAGTWYYVSEDETSAFEAQFAVYGDELLQSANEKATVLFQQLHTLSTGITSRVLDSKNEWPFFSMPHFYKKTDEFGKLLESNIILYAPIVHTSKRDAWLNWVNTSQEDIFFDTFGPADAALMQPVHNEIQNISPEIVAATNLTLLPEDEYLLPVLQYGSGALSSGLINTDLNTHPVLQRVLLDVIKSEHTIFSEYTDLKFLMDFTKADEYASTPRSVIAQPVFDRFDDSVSVNGTKRSVVGVLVAVEAWRNILKSSRPAQVQGFTMHVHDSCGQDMTYVIRGELAEFIGNGDLHDTRYSDMPRRAEFAVASRYDGPDYDENRHCEFSFAVYPSQEYESTFHTGKPFLYAAMLIAVFLTTTLVFAVYDWMVRRRQEKVMGAAQRTTAIVHSLFPKAVGERLIAEADKKAALKAGGKNDNKRGNRLEMFAAGMNKNSADEDDPYGMSEDPIADFFTSTTIMFADIVGFTAWSSTREPKQVFTLLETIYQEFDTTANRRGVFKVETVGDCYVAVAGLPQPRKDHAVVMARFARDCLYRFQALCPQLEMTLGPDTADLAIRVGLHSGPVTAGVLRGERARFQLFGDTMNTASRMESTSRAHKIQISQDTADLLQEANKNHWCYKRTDLVQAKGKGMMQTYWLDLQGGKGSSTSDHSKHDKETATSSNSSQDKIHSKSPNKEAKRTQMRVPRIIDADEMRQKQDRLIRWNVEILTKLLILVQERRVTSKTKVDSPEKIRRLEHVITKGGNLVLDEVEDIIKLPPYTPANKPSAENTWQQQAAQTLSESVKDQLHTFITEVASMYHNNPFHNFEHASHVAMSVVKLMSRIIAPTIEVDGKSVDTDQTLHDHTYGITSDPMTQFACALSAIIHDLDHSGVPNALLVKEQNPLATRYQNKSVAEQNSVDLAWGLLMQERYRDLRSVIYKTEAEVKRFRQLLVNTVMATDIVDKDLGAQRKKRWADAFSEGVTMDTNPTDTINRKATIVLEHLIQASDVAHTMQHFQIYQKWNSRLFQEMYRAYKQGRSDKDPSEFWYQGEIGFFEFYIIPLANKLKDCGVFGVSSDEYLNYATRNKREWMARGHQIVEEFKEEALLAAASEEDEEDEQEQQPKEPNQVAEAEQQITSSFQEVREDGDDEDDNDKACDESSSMHKEEMEDFRDEEEPVMAVAALRSKVHLTTI